MDDRILDSSTSSGSPRSRRTDSESEPEYLEIPAASRRGGRPLIFGNNSTVDFAGQRIKLLRTCLDTATARRELRTILVTSTLPGEGKSTIAANLAVSFGEGIDCGAVALDADLRNPRLHVAFKKPNGLGLADYLQNGNDITKLILASRDGRVALVRAGSDYHARSAELLACGRMRQLLADANDVFTGRPVIIDSAPLCEFPDTWPLAELADGIILVVRANSTPRDLIRETLAALDPSKVLGVVLNQATIRRRRAGKEYYYRH